MLNFRFSFRLIFPLQLTMASRHGFKMNKTATLGAVVKKKTKQTLKDCAFKVSCVVLFADSNHYSVTELWERMFGFL